MSNNVKQRQAYFLIALLALLIGCREETIEPKTFGSVAGFVVSLSDGQEITGARVSTNPPTSSLVTDSLGQFVLENLPTGSVSVRVEQNGFVPEVETVQIVRDQTANIIVRLQPDSLANTAPEPAQNTAPADGATIVGSSVVLRWSAMDVDEEDELTYDVFLFNSDQTQQTQLAAGTKIDTVVATGLDFNSTYFWQVRVSDGLETVNGPVWQFQTAPLPDNRYLYTRQFDGEYRIFSNSLGGNAEFQLTEGGGSQWRPRMGPLRNRIAYLATVGLETHLFVMNRDGSGAQQVSSVPVRGANLEELDFAWLPDGGSLIYMDNEDLYKVKVNGSDLELLATAPNGFTFTEASVSAAGDRILARVTGSNVYESAIFLMDMSGEYLEIAQPDAPGATNGPHFSPDGNWMVYTQDMSGVENLNGRQLDSRIFLKNLNDLSQPPLDLSEEKLPGTNDLDARFSPDGAWIICVNTNNDGISPRNIVRVSLDGDDRELLFEGAEMPDWR